MTVFRDLSQHIIDIAENGVNAGATLLHIDIAEDLSANQLAITIQDNGSGMKPEMLRQITDPWTTTRSTRKIGLGIPFFKQTAEMCGGHFEIRSKLGQGTTTKATFQHNHIDRPPLGDLTGTILCMVVGYHQVDLIYRHHINEAIFSFNTQEVREVLGNEVPLSDPDVLAFLREQLGEGLRNLRNEALPGL